MPTILTRATSAPGATSKGTALTAAELDGRFPVEWGISDGTDINKIDSYNHTSGYYATVRKTGETTTDVSLLVSPVSGSPYKKAVAMKPNDYRVGAQGQSSTNLNPTFIPTVNQLRIGANRAGGSYHSATISRLTYWPVRLTNAILEQITA